MLTQPKLINLPPKPISFNVDHLRTLIAWARKVDFTGHRYSTRENQLGWYDAQRLLCEFWDAETAQLKDGQAWAVEELLRITKDQYANEDVYKAVKRLINRYQYKE